jgi:ribosomal protein S18 acetylase RimI-like enzyme
MGEIVFRLDKDFDMKTWLQFYHACDWNRDFTVANMEATIRHAYLVVTAWSGDEMVGTLTVLSDGMNYATIDDVVVHPDWRRRGIGTGLLQQALNSLGHIQPDRIRLHAIPGVEPFYARLGFERLNETPMHYTNST